MEDIVKLVTRSSEKKIKENSDDIKKLMQWHSEQYGYLINKVNALEAKFNLLLDKSCDPSYQVRGCVLRVNKPDDK